MLPVEMGGFATAVSKATPHGLTIVEDAIDAVITQLTAGIGQIKPAKFAQDAFIPESAYGTSDAAPALALHHAKAQAVMVSTLEGVLADLEKFRDACKLAHSDVTEVEEGVVVDFKARESIVDTLGNGAYNQGDTAYNKAVNDNVNTVATEHDPTQEG